MPPKAKFTKLQIAEAGIEIVRSSGAENLTARALGNKLGSSACPIFTVFKNMDEVKAEVKKRAKGLYAEYVKRGLEKEIAFKGVGEQYILFAVEEPKLFQMLFMSEQEQKRAASGILPLIDDSYEDILASVENGYGLSKADAEKMYRHLWIYTHGIAALCATNMCVFTASGISEMMSEVFIGLLKEIKGAKK